jgi:hypothetical protein
VRAVKPVLFGIDAHICQSQHVCDPAKVVHVEMALLASLLGSGVPQFRPDVLGRGHLARNKAVAFTEPRLPNQHDEIVLAAQTHIHYGHFFRKAGFVVHPPVVKWWTCTYTAACFHAVDPLPRSPLPVLLYVPPSHPHLKEGACSTRVPLRAGWNQPATGKAC